MPSAREGPPQPSRPPASGVGGVHSILPRAGRRQPRTGRVAPRAGPSRGLRGQAPTQPAVHFYAAAPVQFYAAVDRALAEWTNWQTCAIQPCLQKICTVLAIRLVIGAAIREHGIALGDSRFNVDFNPSRNPRIADIKRRAADLIDAIESIAGKNPPREIARFKALTVTDIEAVAMWTAKVAAQSGRCVMWLVTCRLVAPAPSVEAPHATPAARLDRCPPRDPSPTRRCVAPRTKTASQHTRSTSASRHAGRAKTPDAAARWRRLPARRPPRRGSHLRRPRRPYAAPLRAHLVASRHPVLTLLPQATLSHQTLLHPSTPAFGHFDPRGAPCTKRLDGSPRAQNRPRRRRKYPKCRPCRIDAHDSALRARHAPRAQRTPQHRRFDYNILWPGRFIIAESG